MLRAYFDTNGYSGIVDGKVPAEDVAALEAAFRRGALIAPVSPAILDELAGEVEIDRAAMIRKLTVPRRFGSFQGMLKMPREFPRRPSRPTRPAASRGPCRHPRPTVVGS
jgi:hypothetical protein